MLDFGLRKREATGESITGAAPMAHLGTTLKLQRLPSHP
jgi:hypothetical protein